MRKQKDSRRHILFWKRVLYLVGLYAYKNGEEDMTSAEKYTGELIIRIDKAICSGKLYLDPNLSITKVAKEIGTNRTYLSKSINLKTGQNFNEYINNYRSEHARNFIRKSLLSDEGKSSYDVSLTMSDVASASGFRSLRALNRYHVKKYGVLPSEYKNDILTEKISNNRQNSII
jgi:AraC-like DNA-binding protein